MKKSLFNGGWELDGGGTSLLARMSGQSVPNVKVQLPHDAMIHETPVESADSGAQTGFYPGGEYVYVKTFDVPADWEGKEVVLRFGGVYQIAKVYLNGDHVATNLHGYGHFDAVLDPYLKYGQPNEIKVIAENPTPNSRWYSGSGIYRGVTLMIGEPVHIARDGIRITTKEAEEALSVVEVETKVRNLTRSLHKLHLVTRFIEVDSGREAASDRVEFSLYSQDTETLRQNIAIPEAKLWDCDHPNLYDVKVALYEGDTLVEEECVRTGIRILSLDGVRGFRINGKSVKQRGTCIHHDNGILGAATFAAAEDKRAREMKAAGFNAVRSAHHPMSTEMLDACDRYGLVVMDELSDMWFEQKNKNDFANCFGLCWEEEVERMVAKDYNHPCVILYSTGNEILDLGRPSGGRLNRRIGNKFHALDATRFTTTAVNGLIAAAVSGVMPMIIGDILRQRGIDPAALQGGGGAADSADSGVGAANMMMSLMNDDAFSAHPLMTAALEEAAQATDIAGYNYLTGRHVPEKEIHPHKPVLGTETYPADIVRLWRIVEDNAHVLGDYTWTGYDYLGEAGCGIFYYDGTVNFSSHFPDRLAYVGDINILGSRRPISYLREVVFGLRRAPYIGVVKVDKAGMPHSQTAWIYKDTIASWTWPGQEGKVTEVDVYSVDEEVELFVNGKSLGRKPCGRENGFIATYEVAYEPGEITAVGYAGGAETERFTLRTAQGEPKLTAQVDRSVIKAGGDDLSFIKVSLKDALGVPDLHTVKTVKVTVEGAGVLQAYGSAEPQPTRSYDEDTWETYEGEVMAAVRSTDEAGTIKVRFAAEGCEDLVVELTSEN